jgi:hypothetical protein
MSQQPPNPYGNPPPPPPYGQGFPQQPPPYGYPQQPFVPQRTSGTAIASLVLGILGICPLALVGGLLATVLGIIGIGSTGKPGVKGRGLAIAGLILGLLSLLMWAGIGGLVGMGVRATAPDRALARQFLTDLSTGNTAAAQADCVPGTSPDLIQQASDQLKPLGPLTDTTFFSFNINTNVSTNGSTSTAMVAGKAQFGTATKSVQVQLSGPPGGKRLVQTWTIQ